MKTQPTSVQTRFSKKGDEATIENILRSHLRWNVGESQNGFLAFEPSPSQLEAYVENQQYVIHEVDGICNGYLLVVGKSSQDTGSFFSPLVHAAQSLSWQGQLLSEYDSLLLGQVCVNKRVPHVDTLSNMYRFVGRNYEFDVGYGEIDTKNAISFKAHTKRGWEKMGNYDSHGRSWDVLAADRETFIECPDRYK